MPKLSTADHTHAPPTVHIPPQYNAAYDLLQRNLRAGRGEKPAFIDEHGQYSYRDLAWRVDRFANVLRKLGVQPEQRILLCLHDGIDFPTAFLGAIQAGVVPIPVNTLLTQGDYEYMLSDSRAQIAVVSAPLAPLFAPLLERVSTLHRIIISGAEQDDGDSLSQLMADISPEHRVAETRRDDSCFWLYSSGSTGRPKGTVHVHGSLIYTAELYARAVVGFQEDDTVFSAAKLFFAYGLGNALTFPMAAGATSILMSGRATPASVFELLNKYRPTIFCGVPTLYASMLAYENLPARNMLRLRRCVSAGEPLPKELGERWAGHFDVDILDGIGSTEMLHIFLSNNPGEVQYGTTGRPVPGYKVRLVDDHGHAVEQGELGELQICGPSSAIMYWNNRDKSRHTFLGEWTRSGDRFRQNPDGTFVYAGRTDDMIKVSGIYVSPAEVEASLISHPAVLEAAVVGREDRDKLIKTAAFVVLKPGTNPDKELAEELKQHVKNQLAPYKYPRWVEFVDELPKTATGKIQRFKLRAGHT